jgi:hypothetical protein
MRVLGAEMEIAENDEFEIEHFDDDGYNNNVLDEFYFKVMTSK